MDCGRGSPALAKRFHAEKVVACVRGTSATSLADCSGLFQSSPKILHPRRVDAHVTSADAGRRSNDDLVVERNQHLDVVHEPQQPTGHFRVQVVSILRDDLSTWRCRDNLGDPGHQLVSWHTCISEHPSGAVRVSHSCMYAVRAGRTGSKCAVLHSEGMLRASPAAGHQSDAEEQSNCSYFMTHGRSREVWFVRQRV